ncbi:hypothetical protein KP509_31G029600 [Ceratopteris richardii]|uniref:Secreted protein n=1 Tax=Ceratopteris richardii TaxID=49495 RepID=A0A8T2QY49_CERRI|nr:hypothetical protein KP509_31G029600 [Ceratopteris richardii]
MRTCCRSCCFVLAIGAGHSHIVCNVVKHFHWTICSCCGISGEFNSIWSSIYHSCGGTVR